MNKNIKAKIGLVVDILMYAILLLQMGYALIGNVRHEWLGIGFFVCFFTHIYMKRRWFLGVIKRKINIHTSRGFADLTIILLMIAILALMINSIGVSRTLFPNIKILGNPTLHKLLATLVLTISVIHGGMHAYWKSKNKKMATTVMAILDIAAFCVGWYGVPYIDRHFKIVNISSENLIPEDAQFKWKDKEPLVVYFTRVGNTDFEDDVDAVSGASLLIRDGELMGNTQLMADYIVNMTGCKAKAIEVTDYKYPSSYSETCVVAKKEIDENARPNIEVIDTTEYDSIILIYPIWWGTIPNPVASFLESSDYTGKTVYLVATQGSNGFGASTKDIMELVPDANIIKTISVYCDDIPKSGEMLKKWFIDNNVAY